LANQEKYGN